MTLWKRGDFQLAYGYVEMMENLRTTTEGHGDAFDRNVSSVGVDATAGKGDGKGKYGSSYVPPAEWAKMSPEDRKKLQTTRDKKKAKKGRKGGKGAELKRKLSELAAETARELADDADDDSDDGKKSGGKKTAAKGGTTSGGPHDQFGWHEVHLKGYDRAGGSKK